MNRADHRLRILAGALKGRVLTVSDTDRIRPTSARVREAMFNRLRHGFTDIGFRLEGARVADLFAGTGALGMEALSRGASHATLVEQDPDALNLIRGNIANLQIEDKSTVLAADATNIPSPRLPVDLVLMDPPYGQQLTVPTLINLATKRWLMPGALVTAEGDRKESLDRLPGYELLDYRDYGRSRIFTLQAA